MSTVAERIAKLEAMPEEERTELLAINRRDYYDFEEEDKPDVKRILEHFGLTLPLTMSSAPKSAEASPSSGEYDEHGYDKYGSHFSHSEQAKAENREAFEDRQRVAQINQHKHGTPTHEKGERTELGPTQGPQAYVGTPPPTDLESDIGHAFSALGKISR